MDLDIEEYNYAISSNLEYSIKVLSGVCTQIIDSPVTRSSLLYENQSFLLDLGEFSNVSSFNKRSEISKWLTKVDQNSMSQRLRAMPLLFANTIISHLSYYMFDQFLPRPSNHIPNNNNNDDDSKESYYSLSMHLYHRSKTRNTGDNNNNNNNDRNRWNHLKLVRKIMISSLCSLLTYPLYTTYVRIAFDINANQSIGDTNNKNKNKIINNPIKFDYKYPINRMGTNLLSILKKIIYEQNDGNLLCVYDGFVVHLLHNILYESSLHYLRELLIELSPFIHRIGFVDKYLSKKVDPFEYAMFCIWWIPPVLCRVLTYPLTSIKNKMILYGNNDMQFILNKSYGITVRVLLKKLFHGVTGNTTRFMTEVQMMELFGLWSLIRFSHKSQYNQLIFEQDHDECTICYGDRGKADIIFIPCGHKFCRTDAFDVIRRNMNCPTCRRPIQNSFSDLGSWKKLFLL